MQELEPQLITFCEQFTGSVRRVTSFAWEHGESQVWRVEPRSGPRVYLKAHRKEQKFRQELHAYLNWTAALGLEAPQLLAVREEQPWALLLSEVPGVPLESLQLDRDAELTSHRQAGELLAKLHDQQVDPGELPPADEAFAKRLEQWSQRAVDIVETDDIDWVGRQVQGALSLLRGMSRVPCHRDYTPRNWLWDERHLGVMDFEHARADIWFLDVERLWADVWTDRPDLREAFMAGYGRELSESEESVLSSLAALGALSTIVWAREHDDVEFEEQGRRRLERLRLEGGD